jgi:NTP pyrophosphatase (non-canonical NTP hydrolase)
MIDLTQLLIDFRDARDCGQFHNPKDLALVLSMEAVEFDEAFLWKKAEEAIMDKIIEELADVFAYALLLAHSCGLDEDEIIRNKVAKNELKYHIEKSKECAKKYTEL